MINIFSQAKAYLMAILLAAIFFYVWLLKNDIQSLENKNQVLTNQLTDSMAAEVTLTNALNSANDNLDLINKELSKRDRLAAKALEHSKKLDNVINSQREQLATLKEENEQYKNWSSQPVPFVVNELFRNARDTLQNIY